MQHILGRVRRCVEDYHMIEPGETVAVGVSGGKDSLLTLDGPGPAAGILPGGVSGTRYHPGDGDAGDVL